MAENLANENCSICLEEKNDPEELPCKHSFCAECLQRLQDASADEGWANQCPLCRAPINRPIAVGNEDGNLEQTVEFEIRANEVLIIWADGNPNVQFEVENEGFLVQHGVVYNSVLENGTPVQVFEPTNQDGQDSMEDYNEEGEEDIDDSMDMEVLESDILEVYDPMSQDGETDEEYSFSELVELVYRED